MLRAAAGTRGHAARRRRLIMRARHRRLLTTLLGLLCALGVVGLLLATRYQLESARHTLKLQGALRQLAQRLDAQLQQGSDQVLESSRPVPSAWHRLQWADGQPPSVESTPLNPVTLQRLLSDDAPVDSPWRVDLLPTTQSGDVLVLALSMGSGPDRHWSAAWAQINDVLAGADVAGFIHQGYRLRIYDASRSAAWYSSDAGDWAGNAIVPLEFATQRLELQATSRRPAPLFVPMATPTMWLALAATLWLSLLLRQRQELRDARLALRETEQRRGHANALYSAALGSLAELESRLHLVSLYDDSTGLGNRSSLLHRLEERLTAMRVSPAGAVYVIAVGFDSLQQITSSFGADAAARVFTVAVQRIAAVLSPRDALFRGADQQLTVVMSRDAAMADEPVAGQLDETAEHVAQRIAQAVEPPIALDGHTIMLHPSIGIAPAGSGYERAQSLLDQAAMALAAVPHEAEVRYCRYNSAAARASAERLQLEADLGRAFEEQQFELEFEPFVQPLSQAVVGFEALIRWNHPTEGRLLPGRFLPLALQAGMAHRLNSWVMAEAARWAARWRRAGFVQLFVNFNLTAEAFLRPNLVGEIAALLNELELPGTQLVIELTESTLVQDARAAARTLQALSELGVGAWLDDFGTGYSSLSHLRSLPLKGVKIDRAFIEHIGIDSRDFGFLKALIDLISYLGMQSIAEGVETVSQYELLSMTSCDLYQGHYFARSMPAGEVERWLRQRAQIAASGRLPIPGEPAVQLVRSG